MSKTTEALRKVKIYNDYEITSDGNPMIWLKSSGTRDVTPKAVVISIKGRVFKGVPWYQSGDRWFTYIGGKENRDKAYQQAFDWMKENFPKIEMIKAPFDRFRYVSKEDLEKALKKINKNKEETKWTHL